VTENSLFGYFEQYTPRRERRLVSSVMAGRVYVLTVFDTIRKSLPGSGVPKKA
jgi:hypothetical protein